jgi:hypothetical protein
MFHIFDLRREFLKFCPSLKLVCGAEPTDENALRNETDVPMVNVNVVKNKNQVPELSNFLPGKE